MTNSERPTAIDLLRAPVTAAEPETSETLAKYDLTSKLTPFLDRHLVLQMLTFLEAQEVTTKSGDVIRMYDKKDVLRAQLQVLKDTHMVDSEVDKYQEIGEKVPADVEERKQAVIEEYSEVQQRVFPLLKILENEEQLQSITNMRGQPLSAIIRHFDLEGEPRAGDSQDIFKDLLTYSKMNFEMGNYEMSKTLLNHYRSIVLECEGQTVAMHQSMVWGLLASLILNGNYEEAAELILALREILDPVPNRGVPGETPEPTTVDTRSVLIQRSWLLHWSLFLIFQSRDIQANSAMHKLLEWFYDERSLSTISIACPHLFRYVGACLIINSKRLKHLVKTVVDILSYERHSYSDPILQFLLALYQDLDFDEAQLQLQRCKMLCKGDFFLSRWWDDTFEENARLLIFEMYCRIHQCINIEMIASKLNMEAQEAELWIVKLIQNAKLEARIDSAKRRVVMSKAPPSVYQQVIEKTKNLSFRSTMLLSNLEKRDSEKRRA